jgi:hypothetical protein
LIDNHCKKYGTGIKQEILEIIMNNIIPTILIIVAIPVSLGLVRYMTKKYNDNLHKWIKTIEAREKNRKKEPNRKQ